jgi:hypothetical protein
MGNETNCIFHTLSISETARIYDSSALAPMLIAKTRLLSICKQFPSTTHHRILRFHAYGVVQNLREQAPQADIQSSYTKIFGTSSNKLSEQVKPDYSALMHFASTSLPSVSATIRYQLWDEFTPEQTKSLHGLV